MPKLTIALLTALLTATANAATVIQLDPLPYGSVQLGSGQYLLPNVDGNLNVVIYSKVPLTFAEPGRTDPPKLTLTLSPLPAGAIRLNNTQYLLPNAMPQATILVFSKAPLDFQPTSATVDAPAVASITPEVQGPMLPPIPAALADQPPAQAASPLAAPAPVPSLAPAQPALPPALTTEVREPRLPGFPGLPENLKGNITATEKEGKIYFSYSLTNVGHDVYTLNPSDLRITQEGTGIRARLDRRNGNLTPGTIPPNRGEIGTITTTRKTSGPVTFKWVVRSAGGQTYTLSYTYDAAAASITGHTGQGQ